MNAAEEMVVGAARQAAERGDVTALVASLLIIVDNQQATIQRVRSVCDQWHSLIGTIPISEVLRALDGERAE